MSFLVFAAIDFPNGTATTAHNTLMVKGIRKNGKSSFLIIPFGSSNAKELNNFKTKGHFQDVPFFFMNKKTELKRSNYYFQMLHGMLASSILLINRKWKKKRDIAIIYSPDFYTHLPIILTCFIIRIPLFTWQVEKMSINKKVPGIKGWLNHYSNLFAETHLHKFSKGIIVISSLLKKDYCKYYKEEKILVSPILVNSDIIFEIPINDINNFKNQYNNKRIIVYSGTFGENDGFTFIIKAFKEFVKYFPDSILITTGKPGKYYPIENMLNLVKENELTDHFHYLGLVSREKLLSIINAADLLLVCRSNSVFANYGFPWKLGEYCMTANPIIATKVGDVEKYFIDGEEIFLAEPENYLSIYNKMCEVFYDYKNAKKVAERGYNKAKRIFDYKNRTKEVIDFIKLWV